MDFRADAVRRLNSSGLTRRQMLQVSARASLAAWVGSQLPGPLGALTTPVASAQQADFSGITLRAEVGSSEVPIFNAIGPDWEALTGAKLQTDFTAFNERALKLATMVATQDPTYDVIYAWEGYVQKFGTNLYDDMNPLLGDTSDFLPGTLQALTINGALCGAPLFNFVWFLLYNKKMFQAAGINTSQFPTTWSQLYALAPKLTNGQIYPMSVGWYGGPFYAYTYFLMWLNSTPTRVLSEDHTSVMFGNDDGLAAFQSIYDGYKANFFDPNGLSSQSDLDTQTIFKQGNTAMCFAGPDVWSEIQSGDASTGVNIAPTDVGVAIVPGIQPATSGTINGFEGLGINRFSKQKDAALHFINYMTSPEVQRKIMLELGKDSLPSSRSSVLTDPSVQSQYPIAGALAQQGSFTALRYSAPFDLTPAFDSAIRDMFSGNASPQQARDECVSQCEQIIAKYLSS